MISALCNIKHRVIKCDSQKVWSTVRWRSYRDKARVRETTKNSQIYLSKQRGLTTNGWDADGRLRLKPIKAAE
ncbi:hypothetical protein F7725_008219 [Dissostichus mawsoni]|uniref:Uncharacterized protein n=1 Tax=Dissostichus mawsoni TaxID=36200 RepID=A0A7J5Y6I2_DISMA|nr:hypothetical protein F7725_008219 [Dissostichus mawsoni]